MSELARVKARPTIYRGTHMRSRLEARVAGIFDLFDRDRGVDRSWEYEPHAFASGRAQYLPDFLIWPTSDCHHVYVEVRPTIPRAAAAGPQMRVILDSEPGANLWSICPYEGGWALFRWAGGPSPLLEQRALVLSPLGHRVAHARDDAELVAWLYLHPCRLCAEIEEEEER